MRRPAFVPLLATFVLGVAPPQVAPSPGFQGPAGGVLELPGWPPEAGFVLGELRDASGSLTLYALQATLTDLGAACPACFIGAIDGTLSDGVGAGPDYLVTGGYGGDYPAGAGSFSARIHRLDGTPIGRIDGHFVDTATTTGVFRGRWVIDP